MSGQVGWLSGVWLVDMQAGFLRQRRNKEAFHPVEPSGVKPAKPPLIDSTESGRHTVQKALPRSSLSGNRPYILMPRALLQYDRPGRRELVG